MSNLPSFGAGVDLAKSSESNPLVMTAMRPTSSGYRATMASRIDSLMTTIWDACRRTRPSSHMLTLRWKAVGILKYGSCVHGSRMSSTRGLPVSLETR